MDRRSHKRSAAGTCRGNKSEPLSLGLFTLTFYLFVFRRAEVRSAVLVGLGLVFFLVVVLKRFPYREV
jgi:hypothetical protein